MRRNLSWYGGAYGQVRPPNLRCLVLLVRDSPATFLWEVGGYSMEESPPGGEVKSVHKILPPGGEVYWCDLATRWWLLDWIALQYDDVRSWQRREQHGPSFHRYTIIRTCTLSDLNWHTCTVRPAYFVCGFVQSKSPIWLAGRQHGPHLYFLST